MKKISELEELIPLYGENNSLKLKYQRIAGEQNSKIKELMSKNKLDSYTSGAWTANITVKHSESIDEEALLKYLKNNLSKEQLKGIIKKKEYVDSDALESAIYNNLISEDIVTGMDSCKIIKTSPTLNIKKGN